VDGHRLTRASPREVSTQITARADAADSMEEAYIAVAVRSPTDQLLNFDLLVARAGH
jgi:hypothetical protein